MDDEEVLQCQLDLMHALQTRRPLRQVQPEERPWHIGGCKPSSGGQLSELQAEFMQSSLAMQLRVRPRLESMHEIRRNADEQDAWRQIQKDIRNALLEGDKRESRRGPMLLFQLQRLVEGKPGWRDLLQEVKEPLRPLQPIEFDGFHIVKGYDSKASDIK